MILQGAGQWKQPLLRLQLAGVTQSNSCGIRLPPKRSLPSLILRGFVTVLVNRTTETPVGLFLHCEEAEMSFTEQAFVFCPVFRHLRVSVLSIWDIWNQYFLLWLYPCMWEGCDVVASYICNKLIGWLTLHGKCLPGLGSACWVSSEHICELQEGQWHCGICLQVAVVIWDLLARGGTGNNRFGNWGCDDGVSVQYLVLTDLHRL